MSFLLQDPGDPRRKRKERLVCSECHIAFGVYTPRSRRAPKQVVCWLIHKDDLGLHQ
jgi:hypothetical protein